MISIFNNLIAKTSKRLKEKNGMTLVEVVVAFFIIAIVSTVLVRGTVTAVNTMRINKSKTEALAIANEKIEIIKAIDYSEVIITEEDDVDNPWTSNYSELPDAIEEEFDILYDVTWVLGDDTGYKQLKITVFGEYMTIPLEVVTQLYPPVGEEATIVNIYPPPKNLVIFSDEGDGESRKVVLNWEAPDTERVILKYNVYRDDLEFPVVVFFDFGEEYSDLPGDTAVYTYQVTAVYDGDVESVKSNSVITGTPFVYPAPVNLTLEVQGGGPTRTAYLAWEAPDTQLIITEFQIYREDLDLPIGNTQELTFDYIIEAENYTFYVIILYENDNLSGPSDLVTSN